MSNPVFQDWLRQSGLKKAPHWTFPTGSSSPLGRVKGLVRKAPVFWRLGLGRRLSPTRAGYIRLGAYFEDVYFMRKDFARRYDWFLTGKHLYFEDVHLCEQRGVCELAPEIAKLTAFPVYLNASRAYHLRHRRFYYQLEDPAFTDGVLKLRTDDSTLRSLQAAIEMYRAGRLTREEALRYTRHNPDGMGSQNLNYRYHMEGIRAAQARDGTRERASGGGQR